VLHICDNFCSGKTRNHGHNRNNLGIKHDDNILENELTLEVVLVELFVLVLLLMLV
jgi:hypothetical protein